MNISKVTHQVKLDRWTAILKEQNSSGLSIKDWCSQNGITRDQFFYWKRKLKESVLESALLEIVPQPRLCNTVLIKKNIFVYS